MEPDILTFEEQDLCNLEVKHALGCADNIDEEKNVLVTIDCSNDEFTGFGHEATLEIVSISSIEQSLCLVDQSPTTDNFKKCEIVTEEFELIPMYVEHITIPLTSLDEFGVKNHELTRGSMDLSVDNILKPYKVDLRQRDFKQQVKVFLERISSEKGIP